MAQKKGFKHKEETKQKISRNNAKFWLGKKRDEKTKKRISKANKGKQRSGNPENWKRTAETRRKISEKLKGRKAWNKKYPDFWNCEICKKDFPNKTGHKRKFCSKQCMIEAQKSKIINGGQFKEGDKHIGWNGGTSCLPYTIDWTKTLRQSIRERDNYTCQICGLKQNEDEKVYSVHHIDYDKKNNNPDNLITLCACCHSKTNFNRNYWIDYFNLAF